MSKQRTTYSYVEDRFDSSAENYDEHLRLKIEAIAKELLPLQIFGPDATDEQSIISKFDIFPSPVKHYRARCRFAIGEIDGTLHYLLYEHGEATLIADYFPQACEGICRSDPVHCNPPENALFLTAVLGRLMPLVLEAVTENEELRLGLKAVHFLGTQRGEPVNHVVTLIYERPLPDTWAEQAPLPSPPPLHACAAPVARVMPA